MAEPWQRVNGGGSEPWQVRVIVAAADPQPIEPWQQVEGTPAAEPWQRIAAFFGGMFPPHENWQIRKTTV